MTTSSTTYTPAQPEPFQFTQSGRFVTNPRPIAEAIRFALVNDMPEGWDELCILLGTDIETLMWNCGELDGVHGFTDCGLSKIRERFEWNTKHKPRPSKAEQTKAAVALLGDGYDNRGYFVGR